MLRVWQGDPNDPRLSTRPTVRLVKLSIRNVPVLAQGAVTGGEICETLADRDMWLPPSVLIDSIRAFEARSGSVLADAAAQLEVPAPSSRALADAFAAGATAMRVAILEAKYDACKIGQLDLSRFQVTEVPYPVWKEPKP